MDQGKRPLLNIRALKNRPFVLGALGLSLLQFICLALGFLIPSFSQIVTGERLYRRLYPSARLRLGRSFCTSVGPDL